MHTHSSGPRWLSTISTRLEQSAAGRANRAMTGTANTTTTRSNATIIHTNGFIAFPPSTMPGRNEPPGDVLIFEDAGRGAADSVGGLAANGRSDEAEYPISSARGEATTGIAGGNH